MRQNSGSISARRLEILARRHGTPLYVYDWQTIARSWREFDQELAGLPHLICAAVKANANLALLGGLAKLGSGFDIVSGGELARVLRAGGAANRVVFSGVGKTRDEMDAALQAGVLLFNVESAPELALLEARARARRQTAAFGIRVNPNIAAPTHPHIATGLHRHKFGLAAPAALALYEKYRSSRWLRARGLSFHIGSQILDPRPFATALAKVLPMIQHLRQFAPLGYLDIGGGLGIDYRHGRAVPVGPFLTPLKKSLAASGLTLLLEPGRRLFASAGLLLTRVLYIKDNARRRFVIVDAGHNDLIRPAFYDAWHRIAPLRPRPGAARRVDIVGPICETADFFALERPLAPVRAGDLLAIYDAGAYGFSLSSNYNARPRAAEVLLENGRARLIRRRETHADLMAPEILDLKQN